MSVKVRHKNEGYQFIYSGSEVIAKVRTPRVAELADYMPKEADTNRKDQLVAPIAGLIVSLNIEEGNVVKAGQELLVLEAMKMENVITADYDAVIKKLHIGTGDSVQVDQVLIEFGDLEEAEQEEAA